MERLFDKVLVTGGAGYCGARLVPQMLARGYKVTVFDIMFFGNQFLPRDNPNLRIIDGDIRDAAKFAAAVAGHDAVVNLACISNDASFELDEDLSTSINLNAFEPLVVAAKKAGVKRFVYASSSSVYGVSDNPDVTEDHPLVPLTLYNKYKGMCEPLLKKHTDAGFTGVIFRPATVCGYSPRQRLDLSVNILTNHAINAGKITVFGGSQLRPNLHIQDYCDAVQPYRARGQGAERDLQRRLSESIADGDRRACAACGWGGDARPQSGRYRHHADRRRPLLPYQLGQDKARARLQAAAHHRGRGARALPGVSRQEAA
jgi:nucleoside-diphosphate-sugar epimerase